MTLSAICGGKFFARRHGDGVPNVVALHGWGRTGADFDASLRTFNALAIDLPGFGATPEPTTAWTTADYATALSDVLDEMDRPVIVVGHSFGGRVAVHLAQQRRSAIAGLVLTGVPLLHRTNRPNTSPRSFRLGKQLHKVGLVSDERMEALRNKYGSADYRAAHGVMRDILVKAVNESYEEQLHAITCPVELVWGDNDTAAPADSARRAEAMLANARLTIASEIDHFLPLSRPDLLASAITRQLESRTP